MDLLADLDRMGGVATRAQLLRLSPRREVDAALRNGSLVPVARGRYVAATAEAAHAAAHAVTGVVAGRSAALHWGWAVRTVPPGPEVIVPKDRRIPAARRAGLTLWWADLGPDDVRDGVTSPDRTLADCLRRLDAAEALSVADSALRDGFSPTRLLALARDVAGPGGRNARWVARHADGRAANPFESSLRAIALTVEGLRVVPQLSIYGPRFLGRPDLVDERLGIVLECDSFEFHGDRSALDRDACRYNRLVVHGWMVLRFSWEQVMFRPLEVRDILEAAVRQRTDQLRAVGFTA